mmetsp:Transcript_35894/g.103151  ORF Transcript_35894/g.103151 Transcript_35894/m.103151 type:complete len:201 (+) Transcript_35894:1524-2126(+)
MLAATSASLTQHPTSGSSRSAAPLFTTAESALGRLPSARESRPSSPRSLPTSLTMRPRRSDWALALASGSLCKKRRPRSLPMPSRASRQGPLLLRQSGRRCVARWASVTLRLSWTTSSGQGSRSGRSSGRHGEAGDPVAQPEVCFVIGEFRKGSADCPCRGDVISPLPSACPSRPPALSNIACLVTHLLTLKHVKRVPAP